MRCVFGIFLVVCGLAVATARVSGNDSVFVPSREWQTVKKGESRRSTRDELSSAATVAKHTPKVHVSRTPIPAGLHIRHNLKTGLTEAKLMDEGESDQNSKEDVDNERQTSLTLHPEKSLTDEESNLEKKDVPTEHASIPFEELKAMLNKIQSDEPSDTSESKNADNAPSERRKKYLNLYSGLKKELESMNMSISTDSEVLTKLFNKFESSKESMTVESVDSTTVQDILRILNKMEFLIHQIDNAELFANMGGMAKIISPSLNSTHSEVKAEALKLLGAAVQSNPKVQLKALESDFVKKLLHMLTVNNKVEVKSHCLFALSALVRQFPAAQKALVKNGGLEVFGKILTEGQAQIQHRILNLINDLTMERQNLILIEDEAERATKIKEYDLTNFEENLLMHNYCQNLVDLMLKSLTISSDIDDFHEIIYKSMIILRDTCHHEYENKKEELLPEIQKMLVKYRDFPKINDDGENLNLYHQQLLQMLQNIINKQPHDEL